MIVRENPNFLRLFLIFRGSVIERIYLQLIIVMVLSAVIVWGHEYIPRFVPSLAGAPFALIGISLSVFLGFRNSACYDRWWEARKVWGHLVSVSRDLARQSILLGAPTGETNNVRDHLLRLNIAFALDLVRHLRGTDDFNQTVAAVLLPNEREELARRHNAPEYLLRRMGEVLTDQRRDNRITDVEFSLFDRTLSEMTGILTACERLRNTPVPLGYTLLLRRTAYLFSFMLPFGFADVLGNGTPLAVGMVAYTFFGLDALSEELEEPFGTLPNDLPIAALARSIEINLRDAMNESDLPSPLEPEHFVLL